MDQSSKLAVAGGIGGIAECIIVQPFDFLKTRYQLSTTPNPPILTGLRRVIHEGGFFRLYRGILPELAGMIPKSSVMYATYATCMENFSGRFGDGTKLSTLTPAAAGVISGVTEAVTVTPFQVVKVRLQTKEYVGRYKHTVDCALQIFRTEGLFSFYTGLGPTLWRNCIWNGVYFGSMFHIKALFPVTSSKAVDVVQTLTAGFIGGMLGTCFNAPFDMVKSRFQSQLVNTSGTRLYRYTLPSLLMILRKEGPRAVYKGFAPKAVRMGLGGGVCMSAFEFTCYLMS